MLLLDANILIDVLRAEPLALACLEAQPQTSVSVITWIAVLVGCRGAETATVETWLERFQGLFLDDAIAREAVGLRREHGLKVPDAIIQATAVCHGLTLATRNARDFPLEFGCVLHPCSLGEASASLATRIVRSAWPGAILWRCSARRGTSAPRAADRSGRRVRSALTG